MLRFTQPAYLLLLLPILLGLALSYRPMHGMARFRKRLVFALRAGLAILLVGALAGPLAYRPNQGLCTIFVLDGSDSIREAERKRAEAFLRDAIESMRPEDAVGIVVFGELPAIEAVPGGKRRIGAIQTKLIASGTNLASALRLASAAFPSGKGRRIVVLSDGNETAGDAVAAAQVAGLDGIQIDIVPLGTQGASEEASVLALESPGQAHEDEPFDLRAIVDSSVAQRAVLELDRGGQILERMEVSLQPGRNAVVLSDRLKGPGSHRYRVTLRAEKDRDTRNNLGLGFVNVRGKPTLLLLQSDPADTFLAEALRSQGLAVDVLGPGQVPTRPEDFQRYEAIVFNDFNALGLTPGMMETVRAAVRETAIGLAMVGGENSFLPGGYYGTPIAEALPVDLDIRQRKSFPSTSILIMVDASGSMGMVEDGHPKIRLAAKAAEETVRLMAPQDRIGVAGSTDGIQFVAPMQALTHKDQVISQIRRLSTGGGGIYIGPTVERAQRELMKETSKVRHFILLADGADSEDPRDALQRIARMKADKITTSVVAIGDGPDVPLLKSIAQAGGGQFYLADRAGKLPAIFTQDAAIMSRSAIEEGTFLPKVNPGHEALKGIDARAVPALHAYCLTDVKPLASVGMRTQKDDPLLASWQYGLGTSLAFTSDAQARWAAEWVDWPGFGPFWAQVARTIGRRTTQNAYQIQVREEQGRGIVDVQAVDRLGQPLTDGAFTVRAVRPDGKAEEIALTQEAPGRFQGRFRADALGSYVVSLSEGSGQGVQTAAFSLAYPAEYRAFRANEPLLERLAAETQGRRLSEPAEAMRPLDRPGVSIQELWPLWTLIAMLLLPLDIGLRRIALPLGEIFSNLIQLFKRKPSQNKTSETPVDRLRQAKLRAQREQEPPVSSPSDRPTPPPIDPSRTADSPQASTTSSGSAGSRLLDAKRKKRTEED